MPASRGCSATRPGSAGRPELVLLPGPYTLVLPNPDGAYPWLTGSRPDTIGVRIPELRGEALAAVIELGGVAATSANLHAGPDPRRLEDVPAEIRAGRGRCWTGASCPGRPPP